MPILYGEEVTEEEVQRRLYDLYHSHERPSEDSKQELKPSYDKKMNQEKVDKTTSITTDQAKVSKKMNQEEVAFSILKKKLAEVREEHRDRVLYAIYHQGRSSMEELLLVVNKITNQEKGSEKTIGDDVSCFQKEEEEEEIKKKKHLQFLIDLEATCCRNNTKKPPSEDIDREEEMKKKKHLEEDREKVAFSILKKKVAEVREEDRDRVLTAIYHQGRSSMEELLLVVNKITNQEKGSEKTKQKQVIEATPSTITEEKNEKVNLGNSATSVRATQEACSNFDYEKKLEATIMKLASQYKEARETKERKQIQVIKNQLPPAVRSSDRTKADNKRKRWLMAALRRNKQPPRIVKMRIS